MMLINSLGTKINNYIIPPFDLMEGDYLTISVPYLFNSRVDKEFLDVITSSVSKKGNNLNISDNIITVEDAIGAVSLWKKIFCNSTLRHHLKRKHNLNTIQIEELLSKNNIDGNEKIFSIGASDQKIISIQIALLKNNHIIIHTGGMDYNGIEKLYSILQNREQKQTIIEIRYPSTNDYLTFLNSNYIELSKTDFR